MIRSFARTSHSLRWLSTAPKSPTFAYQDILQQSSDTATQYRKLTSDFVQVQKVGDREILSVESEGLRMLSEQAMIDIAHLLRPSHLASLASILKDPEASQNDRCVTKFFKGPSLHPFIRTMNYQICGIRTFEKCKYCSC